MTFLLFLRLLLCAISAYFIGCFSTGEFLANRQAVNLRNQGSGSTGATNVFRALGAKPALMTLIGDIIKGAVATGIGMLIAGKTGGYVAGISVACGHIWPIFTRFKGGKGVTTAMGAVLLVQPVLALCLLALWSVLTALLHMTSAPSILAALLYVIVTLIMHWSDPEQLVFTVLLAALLIFAHRENIIRLINGKENKLDFRQRHTRPGNKSRKR